MLVRELVAALRVGVRGQELFVEVGAGRVELLALFQLLRVFLVLEPLALAGLRCRVALDGDPHLGQIAKLRRGQSHRIAAL